jgi:glycosyltransferase involved in cell wall biosynthesis
VALSRVVITVPSLSREFGGPVVKARGLAAALRKIGYPVTVVGVGSAPDSQGLPQFIRFHGTPVPIRLKALASAIREADIVHILGYRDPVGTAAALMAQRAKVPYVFEPSGMHRRRLRSLGLKSFFDRLVGGRVVKRAALIIATSKLEARELREDGERPEGIRLRPNGIELEGTLPLPARGALRARLNVPQEAPLVLSLGRITAKKGLLDLARALATLTGVWGLVAGPDERDGTLESLQAERARLGLNYRLVILPDGLWGRDRAQAFADADVFCLPSETENFGNAALEAAAAGVPVVISDACGAADWLKPTASRIVPYGNIEALGRALREVLDDPEARRASEAAAPRLRDDLSWDAVAHMQHRIYEEVLART